MTTIAKFAYDIWRYHAQRQLFGQSRDDPIAGPQAHGFESHLRIGKTVAGHVRNKYGVRFVPRAAQKLLRETGFGHVKPGPRHPKAASEEEKQTFEKKPGR